MFTSGGWRIARTPPVTHVGGAARYVCAEIEPSDGQPAGPAAELPRFRELHSLRLLPQRLSDGGACAVKSLPLADLANSYNGHWNDILAGIGSTDQTGNYAGEGMYRASKSGSTNTVRLPNR